MQFSKMELDIFFSLYYKALFEWHEFQLEKGISLRGPLIYIYINTMNDDDLLCSAEIYSHATISLSQNSNSKIYFSPTQLSWVDKKNKKE